MEREDLESERARWNSARFAAGSDRGHYESWFVRANHPSRDRAFWIRYTIFSPRGRPEDAVGELWAVYFDGEAGRIDAVKEELPIAACRFSTRNLEAHVGAARLDARSLEGSARRGAEAIAWSLEYASEAPPLLRFDRAPVFARPQPTAGGHTQHVVTYHQQMFELTDG